MDIFADEPSSSAAVLTSDVGVQVDACPSPPAENDEDLQQAEEEAKERALEEEVRETRTLLEEFRRRLEDIEARVGVMEAQQEWSSNKTHNDKAVEAAIPEVIRVVPHAAPNCDDDDDSSSERTVVRGGGGGGVGLGPESVSEIPSYVFLVGLGMYTVVLQVVLKRGAGRSLRLNSCLNYCYYDDGNYASSIQCTYRRRSGRSIIMITKATRRKTNGSPALSHTAPTSEFLSPQLTLPLLHQ